MNCPQCNSATAWHQWRHFWRSHLALPGATNSLYATSSTCGVELPKTCQHNIICEIGGVALLIWQCRVFTWKQNNISFWFKTLCIFLHINKTIWTLKTGQKHRSDGIWCNRTEENIISIYFSFLMNLQIWNGPLHSTLSHNIIQFH